MIGKIIKNMRLSARLTQQQLADKLNVADTTISSYERENSQADFETIMKIAEICNIDFKIIDKDNNIKSLEDFSNEIYF